MKTKESDKIFQKLHQEAVEQKQDYYTDPKTGYMVFTELYHKKRGHCCKSGCRHCPYGNSPYGKGPTS